eukprot:scaffold1505_cov390-Prasinococcus_capsulatus_cf.AAC.11
MYVYYTQGHSLFYTGERLAPCIAIVILASRGVCTHARDDTSSRGTHAIVGRRDDASTGTYTMMTLTLAPATYARASTPRCRKSATSRLGLPIARASRRCRGRHPSARRSCPTSAVLRVP